MEFKEFSIKPSEAIWIDHPINPLPSGTYEGYYRLKEPLTGRNLLGFRSPEFQVDVFDPELTPIYVGHKILWEPSVDRVAKDVRAENIKSLKKLKPLPPSLPGSLNKTFPYFCGRETPEDLSALLGRETEEASDLCIVGVTPTIIESSKTRFYIENAGRRTYFPTSSLRCVIGNPTRQTVTVCWVDEKNRPQYSTYSLLKIEAVASV